MRHQQSFTCGPSLSQNEDHMSNAAVIICGLALISAWVFGWAIQRINRQSRGILKRKRLEKQLLNNHADFGISCLKCGSPASPIPDSNNRYCCEKCGHKFAGVRHDQEAKAE